MFFSFNDEDDDWIVFSLVISLLKTFVVSSSKFSVESFPINLFNISNSDLPANPSYNLFNLTDIRK